jgi:diadenosine tetraphosphate (Ap4A) HIT family hydrolase
MALTKEQIQELRDQLKEQIVHLPPEQKNQALQQIENLSPDALEAMLKQQEKSKPVFRSIIDKEIPSKIIEETPYALAVLDIKPISPGHVIIIPRSPTNSIKSMPSKCLVLANKISKRIVSRLKSKSTEIQTSFAFGEIIINVIPVYEKSLNINSPRTSPKDEELEIIYNKIRYVKKKKLEKIKITSPSNPDILKLNRRIP